MSPAKVDDFERIELKAEIERLKQGIKTAQSSVADKTLVDICSGVGPSPKLRLQTKRLLKGHIHKVNEIYFSGDSRHLVSGSLDGRLIIWDTYSGNKVQIIPLTSSWLMAATFSPSGNFVASGGMDNMVTVHDLQRDQDSFGVARMTRELSGYDGFLSTCRFINDKKLLTGSGDMKICLWDLEFGKRLMELFGHGGDVVTLSIRPEDENIFVTGSVDQTAKLWDLRQKSFCQSFSHSGHGADVNSVFFHPSGLAFCTASEDSTAALFDLRSDQQVAKYLPPANPSTAGFTSCVLSKSGRYLFAGCNDTNIYAWDVLKTEHVGTISGHEGRVTSLSIVENGIAFASASWDENVRVWL